MNIVRINIVPTDSLSWSQGRYDLAKVNATTDDDIAHQIVQDDNVARQDAAQFTRNLRVRLGLSLIESYVALSPTKLTKVSSRSVFGLKPSFSKSPKSSRLHHKNG